MTDPLKAFLQAQALTTPMRMHQLPLQPFTQLLDAAEADGTFATQALNRAARRMSRLADAYRQPAPAADEQIGRAACRERV